MAVRLQMKLGVIAEPDRVIDSPDTVVVVEPSVGSVARSKGNLYLIVTATVANKHAQEATQLAAETIRSEYYYDESAGIRVCIQKAITSANKRLNHQRDRLSLHGDGENGPIGIGVAVVRGNELYVGTIGPAEAYLIRQARLSTLPDPHRERGLPTTDLEPDVWRGEISVGDSLVLVSPNVMAKLGPDELKDAMVTLHPQPAMEHLHHRFVTADGAASDAMIAIEATEVASTSKQRTLVPVRPAEPLAGTPDRGPIPLADNVTDGVAAVQASAFRARAAAGGAFDRLVLRIQDLLPRRRAAYRRVTPAAAKRETQRRAAIAVLALVVVSAGLFGMVWAVGGQGASHNLGSLTAGQAALRVAQDNLAAVTGPGIDLIRDDKPKALDLLTEAYASLDSAASNGIPAATVDPVRKDVEAGLDRIYGVVPVAAAAILPFGTADAKADIGAMIQGPGGAPFVLDRTTKSVYRIDPATHVATRVFARGHERGRRRRGGPEVHRPGRDPRPARRRRAERPVALATGQRQGRRDDDEDPGLEQQRLGRRHPGDRDVRARRQRRACTTSTSSIPRSSRSSSTTRPATARASRPPRSIASPSPATCRRSTRCTSTATSSSPTTATSSGSSTAGPRAGRPTSCPTPCSASSPTTRCWRRRATSGPATSTPTTSRTTGSSRSTRRRARTSSSTASPGTRRAGRTCAGCTSSWPARARRRRWSGPTTTASTRRSWRPSPTSRRPRRRRLRPGRPDPPRAPVASPRASAAP